MNSLPTGDLHLICSHMSQRVLFAKILRRVQVVTSYNIFMRTFQEVTFIFVFKTLFQCFQNIHGVDIFNFRERYILSLVY